MGGIQAQSDDPAFLRNLKKVPSIEVASKEVPLALNQPATISKLAQTTAINEQKRKKSMGCAMGHAKSNE